MALGAAHVFAAVMCVMLIDRGASEWLDLAFALLWWNGPRLLVFVPLSLVLILRARIAERRARQLHQRSAVERSSAPGGGPGPCLGVEVYSASSYQRVSSWVISSSSAPIR